MMMLFVIDHRDHDWQPHGEIIMPWIVDEQHPPGQEYADFCALYNVWHDPDPPDIVGFFGYRKYLAPRDNMQDFGYFWPAHASNWYQCSEPTFNDYRMYLADHDGTDIKALLAEYDILQAAPFPLTNGKSLWKDFADSRSYYDACMIHDVVSWSSAFPVADSLKIYPYLFITRWPIFYRMMTDLEDVRRELHGRCGLRPKDPEYAKRPMAYVMERVYSLWLEGAGLSIKEMPLLHCWEKQ